MVVAEAAVAVSGEDFRPLFCTLDGIITIEFLARVLCFSVPAIEDAC